MGDNDAKYQLGVILHSFVNSLVSKYQNKDLSLEELIDIGKNGVLNAAEKFNLTAGLKFKECAIGYIFISMINAIEEKKEGRK